MAAHRTRSIIALGALAAACASTLAGGAAGTSAQPVREYVVLAERQASPAALRAAVRRSGGTIVRQNPAIGLATVRSRNPRFARVATGTAAIRGVGRARAIGTAIARTRLKDDPAEGLDGIRMSPLGEGRRKRGRDAEPLAGLQWDMAMVGATGKRWKKKHLGDPRVLVGIIDTGIDASHPDIAPNFDRELSRNFTVDIPSIDGACADDPDGLCTDPADVDENGHGTHVAGIVASPVNGIGIAGVAPRATLVNLRAGSDGGWFFLQPTLDAITYAADNGVDVVNMSFFTDPWLFNCRANAADSPAERAEQAVVIDATQRAVDYARARGVTLVSALGNENLDMGLPQPIIDSSSPGFPGGTERDRVIDNSCVNVPAETTGVISVSSVGPSGAKSSFSNYGVEQTDLAAPGGWIHDSFGTPAFGSIANAVLAPLPAALIDPADLNPDGSPKVADIVRDCQGGVCAYYVYDQGTSMAAPHVAGVAALIIAQRGKKRHGDGITMRPDKVERRLVRTASDRPCPTPATVDYTPLNDPSVGNSTALCVGTPDFNGFYGHGIVDARAAVGGDDDDHDDGVDHDGDRGKDKQGKGGDR